MARRKSVCSKWTLVLIVVIFCPFVYPRPQETSTYFPIANSTNSAQKDTTLNPERNNWEDHENGVKKTEESTSTPPLLNSSSRDVKTNGPVIGESIKLVANQLLEKSPNRTTETPILADIRIPPKIKNQVVHKHKIKTRNEDGDKPIENSHVGIAVPMTLDELEAENRLSDIPNESSTSNEGISTWILLSNPTNKENSMSSTEPTKVEDTQKKQKQSSSKNKSKRPQNNKISTAKRPIIGSTNKSDLVAGGSAINENVYNKIKDTVLSNVQRNKNTPIQRTTTISTTTVGSTTEALTTYKEVVTQTPSSVVPLLKVTSKPTKKKNKNKQKTSTTTAPLVSESALLPMEPKEQEIELEISTPATTTKKPKRSSSRKKNKTKKRKTKPENDITELKSSNKTKSNKPSKKPSNPANPITSQIYNYFSREVMPSVGVGVIGLASLVGLASYFLYPFSTPVRRTFEVDKKDDLYRHNAEEYASEGNGQAEEEMLGTVLAGMPAHAKHKLNPYAAQTPHVGRYPVKKDQDIRYRHVTTSYEPNYNVRYPQQKTGIAHGAVYSPPVNYSPHQYETRHVYTTESQYTYDKGPTAYTPYPAVEPIYAAPQTGPSGASFGNDASNSVVYGVKPSDDSDFKPVYPFESQFYSETTSSPITYPPTSMYLGSNNDAELSEEAKFDDNSATRDNNKFVVGNVPKELTESATPAVVPEHGPRTLNRKKRGISGSIEEVLKAAKEKNNDIFISNEIDEALGVPTKNLASMTDPMPMNNEMTPIPVKEPFPVYAVSMDSIKEEKSTSTDASTLIFKNEIIESVSTLPIDQNTQEKSTTETELSNDLTATTPVFKVYEVFSTPATISEQSNTLDVKDEFPKVEITTQFKSVNTETTTELKSETTSTMPPSPSPVLDTKEPTPSTSTPQPTNYPEVITYPPLNQDGGFFSFLKRLIEFKYRLGLSILQSTSDSLNRYLRSMEETVQKVSTASKPV